MTNAVSARRYLALWFPFLSADRLRIQEPDFCASPPANSPPDRKRPAEPRPLALVAKVRGALRLIALDACAQGLGLAPGTALADARVREPDLAVADMDEDADRHWLERLARRCNDWSPLVTLAAPDGITLDIAGVPHLFGGEAGMCGQIEDAFAALGMTVRLAAAATSEAAQALARHGAVSSSTPAFVALPPAKERAAIRALPVVALGLDEAATLALRRAGLKNVGAVVKRPAATIAARFGIEAITALRRLIGDESAPIASLTRPARLRFERRFPEPIAHQAAIAAHFLDLLREGAGALEERGLGGRRFVLTLLRSDGARRRLAIETGLPTRDPALVLRLFDERIATLADPLDPGFGYDALALFVAASEPLDAVQPELDGREEVSAALAELIDRLSTRLGPDVLRRLVPHDSHVPEQAQLALPAVSTRAPAPWPTPPPGEPPMRPLFLFDPPQAVDVVAEVPDGPPHRFRWRRKLHEVRLYEGPERIGAEWWRRQGGELPGQAGLTRDYYRIEDARGRRYWIFRHGLYAEKPDPRWYMHGLFA